MKLLELWIHLKVQQKGGGGYCLIAAPYKYYSIILGVSLLFSHTKSTKFVKCKGLVILTLVLGIPDFCTSLRGILERGNLVLEWQTPIDLVNNLPTEVWISNGITHWAYLMGDFIWNVYALWVRDCRNVTKSVHVHSN